MNLNHEKEEILRSWEMLEEGFNPAQGPVSRQHGFMHDPHKITEAPVTLPEGWIKMWENLPFYFANKSVREIADKILEPIDVEAMYSENSYFSFMKSKAIVFCIAQAWVDSEREIAEKMEEPPAMPGVIQDAMIAFSRKCKSPDYCALADMSLTASQVVNKEIDISNCTFDDFELICSVNTSATPEEISANDEGSAKIRANAENRFHNTPTMMEYRTHDLVGIVADVQSAIAKYKKLESENHSDSETSEQTGQIDIILSNLAQASSTFVRLREGFALLTRHTVDPVVWHRDIVKYTSGYGGHLGLSGPQTPCVHLIDAFFGRKNYNSELGQTTLETFKQIQFNHREYIKSVSAGPNIGVFAAELAERYPGHPLAPAFNKLVDSYINGFLAVHKGRAIEFAEKGFDGAGPREFTAETSYEWPATHNVTAKLKGFFDQARKERGELKVSDSIKLEDIDEPA